MPRSYDSWITEGEWHKCEVCGVRWCDADGGCDCMKCKKCDYQSPNEDHFDDDGLCADCQLAKQQLEEIKTEDELNFIDDKEPNNG